MIFTPKTCPPGTAVIDVDTGEKIARVLSVDDITGEVVINSGVLLHGMRMLQTIRFRSIVEVEDPRHPCTFHCSGRMQAPAEPIKQDFSQYLVGRPTEIRFSVKHKLRVDGMEILRPGKPQRPYAALRDDVATTAHYMGMDQLITVPEFVDPPKAKPALAGLSVIASEGRYQGLGFTDA